MLSWNCVDKDRNCLQHTNNVLHSISLHNKQKASSYQHIHIKLPPQKVCHFLKNKGVDWENVKRKVWSAEQCFYKFVPIYVVSFSRRHCHQHQHPDTSVASFNALTKSDTELLAAPDLNKKKKKKKSDTIQRVSHLFLEHTTVIGQYYFRFERNNA
jgi:ketopantoate reductase